MSTSQANTTATPSTNATSGEATGAQAGNAVKSAYNAIHGGLEKLRGETLSAADAAGDAISNRPAGSAASRTDSSAAIAQKGDAQMNQGVAGLSSMHGSQTAEVHQSSHDGGMEPYGRPLPVPPTSKAQYSQTDTLASERERQSFPPPPMHPSTSISSSQTQSTHHAPPQPVRPGGSSATSRPPTGGVEYPALPARTSPDNVINNSFNDGRAVPGQNSKMLAESGFGKLKTVLQSANGTIENLRKQSLAVADAAGDAIAQRKSGNQSAKDPSR